jgi:hypothetical protein
MKHAERQKENFLRAILATRALRSAGLPCSLRYY